VHRPVVGPLETGVQPGAELDHGPAGVIGQELPHPAVQDHRPDHHQEAGERGLVARVVEVDRVHQLDRGAVAQQRPLAGGLLRPGQQREEQRPLYRAQAGLCLACHAAIVPQLQP
jgi:hypothetical protein